MIKQFNDLSSWRKHDITIEPHELHTLNFKDTRPNIFVIVNSNESQLKIGISNLPRTDSYEFKVEYNTTETVGRPIGTNNLYILNDSSSKASIIVFSIEKEFDPQILKNLNVALNTESLETSSIISGFSEGITVPVDPALKTNQEEILASLANMKSVHISNLQTSVTDKLTTVLTKLDSLIAKEMTLSGDGITLNGVQTDLTTVHANLGTILTNLADIETVINDFKTQESAKSLTGIESSLTNMHNTINNINSIIESEADKRIMLFTAVLEPDSSTTSYIIPDTGHDWFTKIHHMRAIGGSFNYHLLINNTDTVNNTPIFTLDDGDSLNNLEGNIQAIVVNTSDSGARLELIASQY